MKIWLIILPMLLSGCLDETLRLERPDTCNCECSINVVDGDKKP